MNRKSTVHVLLAAATLLALGTVTQASANIARHDKHGYYDGNGHRHPYSMHGGHRGYWNQSGGSRVFINID